MEPRRRGQPTARPYIEPVTARHHMGIDRIPSRPLLLVAGGGVVRECVHRPEGICARGPGRGAFERDALGSEVPTTG